MSSNKGLKKASGPRDTHISISQKSIEISHEGKPISGTATTGYVYLLVDRSSSMEGSKLNQAKKGALNFARKASANGYFTGLIQFDSSAKLVCEPYKDISVLGKALAKLEVGDTTHIAKAINLAHSLLRGLSGNLAMVVVTDGMPNGPGDPLCSLKAGEDAKRDGIHIIAIGTDDADEEFLKRLASHSQLGVKVGSGHLEQTITDASKLLPS